LKNGLERDDRVVREVGVPDGLSYVEENLAPLQLHDLEVRLKPREVFWLQCVEEPILSVKGSLGAMVHGKVSPRCDDAQEEIRHRFRIIIP
jgi:hypothetical protein